MHSIPRYGIDPITGQKYHIVEYLRANLNRLLVCPVCGDEFLVRAKDTITTSPHFAHKKDSTCPTIEKNRVPFLTLSPTGYDYEKGKLLKQELYDNLYLVYLKCLSMTDSLSFSAFKSMIESANKKNVWFYQGLTLKYIPYVLLSCHTEQFLHFKDRFYFVLDPSIGFADDLWNKPTKIKQKIFKIYTVGDKEPKVFQINVNLLTEPSWFKGKTIHKLLGI